MKRRLALMAVFSLLSFSATAGTGSAADASAVAASICKPVPESRCWLPLLKYLESLPPAQSERAQMEVVFSYAMLAKSAHLVGDLAESKLYYQKTMSMADALPREFTAEFASEPASTFFKTDAAALAIRMREYSQALRYLNDVSDFMQRIEKVPARPGTVSLLRCGALIGLHRDAEADAELQAMLSKLDFDGQAPWEAFPFAPEPIHPYTTARRIAARYVKQGSPGRALDLLSLVDERWRANQPKSPDEAYWGPKWATVQSRADLLLDMAAIHLTLNHGEQAELLMREALVIREKEGQPKLRRTLDALASLYRRQGLEAQAMALSARAAAISANNLWESPDPLADTLGIAPW